MKTEWHKIFSPPSDSLTIAPGLQVDFLNCPRGMVQISESITPVEIAQVGIPIGSAELLANPIEMEQAMETPKYCLEAVAIWDRFKIKKGGHVKAFCAYGATEYGTDSEGVKAADSLVFREWNRAHRLMWMQVALARARAGLAGLN